jgi:hypothetical protein
MNPRRTPKSPAFRACAFYATVSEAVYPKCNPSRLHRYLLRHGLRVGYERLATDPWQGGLWPATEAELAELKACKNNQLLGPDDLPF